MDVNLYVRAGAPPTTVVYDCAGVGDRQLRQLRSSTPRSPVIWYALAVRVSGDVAYQITATEFAPLDTDDDGVEDALDNCMSAQFHPEGSGHRRLR